MTGETGGRKKKHQSRHAQIISKPDGNGPAIEPSLQGRFLPRARTTLFVLFFASGFTGLVYEVLWMKELGLLFGNTAHATATTLASFFLGLAAGGYVWGRRAGRLKNPLRAYGLLEAGVAASALLYFLLQDFYHAIYGPLFEIFKQWQSLFIAVKFTLSVGVLFPPAFFMGGTLPVMSQHLVRDHHNLGLTASMLYAVNTFGAVFGAYMAGFHLPPIMGFKRAYIFGILLTGAVALAALFLSFGDQPESAPEEQVSRESDIIPLSPRGVQLLAFLSGFVTLSLEVLWTRMFAQVFQNSVYTFSAILVVFLLCLAIGAALASALARRQVNSRLIILGLVVGSALLAPATPFIFTAATGRLGYLGGGPDWYRYIFQVFATTAIVIFLPGILLGTIFPYLMKVSEPFRRGVGRTVGDLVAINTIGAILGSLCAGFILLDLVGLRSGIMSMGALYLLAVLLLPSLPMMYRIVPAACLALLVIGFKPGRLMVVSTSPAGDETILDVWEGSAATVAVVKRGKSLKIKVNNLYAVGGTESRKWEEWQSHLPLLIHPEPRSVFYLGMGTGITAGASLLHPVKRVVVTEIVPEVVTAAQKHFTPYTNGLFTDGRSEVVVEDGRNYLLGTRERFDVIIADLFVPWKAGTGTLYSREHFRAARSHLKKGGLFVQWLPLFQMSKSEFGIIVRTMLEEFRLVTMWRGDFFSKLPTAALVGKLEPTGIDPGRLANRLRQTSPEIRDLPLRDFIPEIDRFSPSPDATADPSRFLTYYCGNVTQARALFDSFPVNSDDRPLLEYQAPISERREAAGRGSWLISTELIEFLEELLHAAPPERDFNLKMLPEKKGDFIRAGYNFHRFQVLEFTGNQEAAKRALYEFKRIVLPESYQ